MRIAALESYHHIPNSLNNHLSALSNYRIPRMEELYEIAREQSFKKNIKYRDFGVME